MSPPTMKDVPPVLSEYVQRAGSSFTSSTALISALTIAITWWIFRHSAWSRRKEWPVKFAVAVPDQCRPGWEGATVSEVTIKVSGSSAIQCYCPATGQFLGLINPVTPDGIDRAISKATEAQKSWSTSSFTQRRRLLRTLLKFVLDNQEPIVRAACLDSGKTRVDAMLGEVMMTTEKLQWTIDHGEKALQSESRPRNLLMFYKDNSVTYEPLGVVAACVSWNYPFHNFIGPVISALFTGNAIIVKNSEQTAWSSVYFASIVRSALSACGHDPNLVQSVSCWPQTAAHLTRHPGISHITFIGSKPVAHEVAKCAASALTPLCVELGGKDAAIILDDPKGHAASASEMKRIESILLRGVFQSAGQNCIGIERIIAMPEAYRRLTQALEPRIRSLRLGNDLAFENVKDAGVDVGAMISSASFDRLERLIQEAVSQGARLLVGGRRYQHSQYPLAHYFEPTLLVDVTNEMRISQEELFAPICVFMKADNIEHVLDIANGTIYGLGCSVFGPTSSRACRLQLEQVARRMKSGMVAINDFAVTYAVQLPFGGVAGSGYGRFAGEEGLRGLCNIKSVCKDRWPGLIKTAIPPQIDYPMQISARQMGQGVIEVGYGDSLKGKLGGILKILTV